MSEAIIEVLPDFWAAAIVNGDETGMDDDDSRAFNAWIDLSCQNVRSLLLRFCLLREECQ